MSSSHDTEIHGEPELGHKAKGNPLISIPQGVMVLPFDVAREIYAKTVQVGLLQSSMITSRKVSVALDAMEKATLGPWARRL
jgi:hypothetical protein